MVPNSWKINPRSCPGALWAPSWRQDDPTWRPRVKNLKQILILGWPVGFKIELKSMKHRMKEQLDFCNDFETTFSRS